MSIPAEAVTAADTAVAELPCDNRFERDRRRTVTRVALEAAAPLIAAAERQRIRHLATEQRAQCYQPCTDPDCGGHLTATAHSHHLADFADLLEHP